MPRLAPRAVDTGVRALRGHNRRLENLEVRKPVVPSSTLPTTKVAGQRTLLSHATGVWELVWTGSIWQFVGGSDLVAETAAEISYASATYPATAQGPTVTIPAAGTYDVYQECRHRHSHTAAIFTAMSAGSAGSTNAWLTAFETAPVVLAGEQIFQSRHIPGYPLNPGAFSMWHRSPNALTCFYASRQLRVRPRTIT